MSEIDETELAALRAEANRAGQVDAELASVRESAGLELRAAVLAAHPELPEQLVVGSTAVELAESVASASALVASIRERTLADVQSMAVGKPPMGFRPPAPEGARGGAPVPPEGVRGLDRLRFGLESEGAK